MKTALGQPLLHGLPHPADRPVITNLGGEIVRSEHRSHFHY